MNRLAVLVALVPVLAAAAPEREDYAYALDLAIEDSKPVQQFALPDSVYASVRNSDLSDVAVFNGEGLPLAYAWCTASPPVAAPSDLMLPVFPLQAARAAITGGDSTHVEVDSSDRVQITVEPGTSAAPADPALAASIIDARQAQLPLQALRVEWQPADGASELHVRLEASDDLDHWTVIAASTLLQAEAAGQTLRRARIPLPPARYAYLRLERSDPGPQPQLQRVTAEIAPAPTELPARWTTAARLAGTATRVFQFDTAHAAPYSQARVVLPAANMDLKVNLESRADENMEWRPVWLGEVFTLTDGAVERRSPQIRFSPTTDRYWRVQIAQGGQSLGAAVLGLQLGYQPALLRFLAQGAAPYVLAYGSARAGSPPVRACNGLLADITPEELKPMLGQARAGEPRMAAGGDVLNPLPAPAPLRQILLWAVLIGGALLLIRMAMSLLARVNQEKRR